MTRSIQRFNGDIESAVQKLEGRGPRSVRLHLAKKALETLSEFDGDTATVRKYSQVLDLPVVLQASGGVLLGSDKPNTSSQAPEAA